MESKSYNKNIDFAIGIDLGTRFTCISIWRNKRLEIIPDQFGNRTIPSIVAFYKSARLVGHNALSMKEINPLNTIYDIKRIIGRKFTESSVELTKKLLTYKIVDDETEHNNIIVELDKSDETLERKRSYRPEEICSYILSEVKRIASNYMKKNINDNMKAIITVPAYFNDSQRQATLDAANIAGLDIIKIINEPTAAALAYGMGSKKWNSKSGGNIVVYDFGAGTLDVSIINVSDGVFKTLAVGGNSHLGGEDIDYIIMTWAVSEFKKKYRLREIEITTLTKIKLKNAAENAKKILSSSEKTVICLDNFYDSKRLYCVITRQIFNNICNDLFIMAIRPMDDALKSSCLGRNKIDDVILVGGSSRIPKMQEMILEYFNNTKITSLNMSLSPDEVVSNGAAIYGHIMTNNSDPFSDDLVLLDVTPLSLGVETLNKQMTTIIPRNTVIPIKKTKVFTTDTDNQDSVTIKIFEGERKLTKNNYHLGTFELKGFEKAPRGHAIIKITFNVDINGILHITALEKRSDVQTCIDITSTWSAKGRLSKKEINNIIKEAEINNHIDSIFSTKIGMYHKVKNSCESILINIKDNIISLTNADKIKIKKDIRQILQKLSNDNVETYSIDELKKYNEYLGKTYSPLIAQFNKSDSKFSESKSKIIAAEVYGDDEDNDAECYQKVELDISDPSSFDKEEVKEFKKIITELCNNIENVVTNPVCNLSVDDVTMMKDYIGSVLIWLYTTNASTTIEFISKIDEINKYTQEIMSKYDEKKLYDKPDEFTIKDELKLTCVTLHSAIKSNYLTVGNDQCLALEKIINETMLWLLNNPDEDNDTYQNKLSAVQDMCNNMYHNMCRYQGIEHLGNNDSHHDNIEDEELVDEKIDYGDIPKNNIIKENINSILENMPNKVTRINKKINSHSGEDNKINDNVLLKIDIEKINPQKKLNYHRKIQNL